jgi:transketolase
MAESEPRSEQHHQPASRTTDIGELGAIAHRIRRKVLTLVAAQGQGYVQQGLGAADLFTALYFAELRLDPADPGWTERDRFILSTAHNTAVFYATLAERSCIPRELLDHYCEDGYPAEVNASERLGPVVEASCGSLGQGLSVGIGMALSARRRSMPSRVYVLLGDGELQEGQVWEAAMAAAHLKLGNLCAIVDYNDMQVDGPISQVMALDPLAEKWAAFNWNTLTVDGHDFTEMIGAFELARTCRDKPTCLITRTLIGKGVPSLEGVLGHNMRLSPDAVPGLLRELDADEAAP